MSVTELSAALEARLAAIASPLATQWENTTYLPISGTPYQKTNLLIAKPMNWEMGRTFQELGYLQVTLFYPLNAGKGAAMTRAEAIRNWFYKGLTLTSGGLSVTVNETPEISSGFEDDDRWGVPIKIRFFANSTN